MEYSPTVRGRRLIREIERLRHGSGLSMEVAAQRLGWSTSKLYRLENGRSRITTDDLADMLDLYGSAPRSARRLSSSAATPAGEAGGPPTATCSPAATSPWRPRRPASASTLT